MISYVYRGEHEQYDDPRESMEVRKRFLRLVEHVCASWEDLAFTGFTSRTMAAGDLEVLSGDLWGNAELS